ncbi:Rossmann fold domain-containing protein [Erythrobacter cryptus]|uniref:Rossmann fold domain-containing protein n=1 Tax=Erythrobacter cryptus TaxID=196588 RepID=UPI000423F40D|nr:hypothetical protein [Erythrobacter cryptus]
MQRVLEVPALPAAALDAAGAFMAFYLEAARRLIAAPETGALAILMHPAPHDHADWRRALARDLAREAAPTRVNVVAGRPGEARETVLRFLADAPGVTGQYLVCHDDEDAGSATPPA